MASRKTSKRSGRSGASSSRTAARLNLITAGLALAETKARGVLPGKKRKQQPAPGRVAAVAGGGTAIAAAVITLFKRRSAKKAMQTPPAPPASAREAQATSPATVAGPSNYDLAGPPTNTATPAPATPLDAAAPVIDEEAEIAAAAAEAAGIGGDPDPLVSSIDPSSALDEEERPLAEAGQGEAEGQEQAEAALADLISDRSLQASDEGDVDPRAQQIDEAIDAQDDPHLGEHPEMRT